MASTPRAYFFYGSDTRATLQAITRWRRLFEQKHGSSTSFCLEADELDADHFSQSLERYLQGDTLFQEPRLLVVRRVTSQEKGHSTPFTKALLTSLERPGRLKDDQLTIAIWEEGDLAATHPLVAFFSAQAENGNAKIYHLSVPTTQTVGRVARTYLEGQGAMIEPDALRWLSEQYGRIERAARLDRRLKTSDIWTDDYRSWWLYQLLDGAILQSKTATITTEDLKVGHRDLGEPTGPFDIASAISNGNWSSARSLLARFTGEHQDTGDYFSLIAAVRWQLGRRSGLDAATSFTTLRLLADVELISKNGIPEPSWLLSLMLARLESSGAVSESLIPARTLWLAQLPKS